MEISEYISNKNNFRLFLDILEVFLLDVINYNQENISFVEHKELLKSVHGKMKNIELRIEKLLSYKSAIDLNANLKLLLDSLIINLKEE